MLKIGYLWIVEFVEQLFVKCIIRPFHRRRKKGAGGGLCSRALVFLRNRT